MKNKDVALVILLAFLYLLNGCGKRNEVLVRIDDKIITTDDFKKRIEVLPPRYQEVLNENKRKFLDELIIDELLYKEALRKNVQSDKDVKKVIEEAKKKILIAKLLKDEVEDTAKASDEDVSKYYEEHKDEFVVPEVLRASHILVKDEKEAKDILIELANNRNFEDLAKARSVDPAAERGGDIGYFIKGQLDPDFEKVCFELKEGQISDIVKTRFGYHIIKLTERKPPTVASFEEVKEKIKQEMIKADKRSRFNEMVERLKDRARIEVNEKAAILAESKDKEKENKDKEKTEEHE